MGASSSASMSTIPTELPTFDFSTAVPVPVTMTSFRFNAATDRVKSAVVLPSAAILTLTELLA